MKRIAIGDVHLSSYKDDPIQEDGLPLRLSNIIGALTMICTFARMNDIKYIDILGDLNNDKDVIYTDAQDAMSDIMMEFSDLNFMLMSGNHDLSSIGVHQKSSISVFSGYNNVTCVTSYCDSYSDSIDISIVPFSNTMIEEIVESEPSPILLSHFGLSEAQLQSGI